MNNLQKLLTVLKQSDTPLSSRQLSSLLSVSDRSVRNYIKELRNVGEQITANENGYLWIGIKNDEPDSPGNKSQALFAFATPEERINYIIEKLILAKSGLDLYDLADSIYISYSTIEKDMIRVIKTAAEDEASFSIWIFTAKTEQSILSVKNIINELSFPIILPRIWILP